MMIKNIPSSSQFLACIGVLASFAAAACGTGNGQNCDGKTTELCASGGSGATTPDSPGGFRSTSTTVLKIEGNVIRDLSRPNISGPQSNDADASSDDDGAPVILHGVNRSGTEYKCVQGNGIFDGPDSEDSVKAIASWKVNSVRVPLNESCWLNINGSPRYSSGEYYKVAIQKYVALLHKYNIYPILELHWVAPGTQLATGQMPMPDLDHAIDFWKDVTDTFKDDLGVIFELYNEPYPNSNGDNDAAWQCWKNGCVTQIVSWVTTEAGQSQRVVSSYQSVGFQQLVDAVRATEGVNTTASHAILLGGVQYSNRLTQWDQYKPTDSANNLGAAWHIYNFNGCLFSNGCFDGVPATLAASTAIVATEFGEDDCQGTIVTDWMNWFDAHNMSYLAWSWDAYGACRPNGDPSGASPWPLISSYDGTPNPGFGQTVHDHFLAIAQ